MCWLVLISRIVFGQYNMVIYSYPEHKLQIGLQCCFSFGEGYMWSVYVSCNHMWCSLCSVIVYISVCLHGNELPCFHHMIRKNVYLVERVLSEVRMSVDILWLHILDNSGLRLCNDTKCTVFIWVCTFGVLFLAILLGWWLSLSFWAKVLFLH